MLELMEKFRQMVNQCIRIGLDNDASTRKRLTTLSYSQLAKYDVITYYKLCAISHAAGILANRKKSLKRGLKPRKPYATRSLLISCYGFKIADNVLKVPVHSKGRGFNDMIYFDIALNKYTKKVLSDPSLKVRSFTLAAHSFRKKIAGKYGKRWRNRVGQLLHHVSKQVVNEAKENKTAIAFEKLTYIRKLYQKGNYQGRNYRHKLNAWPFAEAKHQIEYKAKWEGVPIIQLTRSETRGTSQLCPQCGKKITQVDRKFRQLYCAGCKSWMDRDVVAAMNISIKGLARFASSKGLAGEAMKGNPTTPVILRVDASKLAYRMKRQVNRT
jgi:putative transposase